MADAHVTAWGEGEPVVLVHGVLTWGTDTAFGFGRQRPLADAFRLLVMDRRGYGRSPDVAHSDYRVDADDIVRLLGDGAHLVGHTYGAVAAMLAAARAPEAVRSLTLIQPGCLQVAADRPVVASALQAARAGLEHMPADLTPETYLRLSLDAVGMPAVPATPERLRAAATTMRERPCWQGDLPVEPLAAAPWPKLVIIGDWAGAPPLYREKAGGPVMVTARVTAERIGARFLELPGYYPHVQHPDRVNDALRALFRAA
ncbi:alpha/beta hydrolase [Actinocorallia libanotica]|uniref:AB hydrolase-1 domain-containing protein n=1 Tax=Actinocorallia libanotica TaxID=46162 RepID=A0ABP4ARI3_9ACTN